MRMLKNVKLVGLGVQSVEQTSQLIVKLPVALINVCKKLLILNRKKYTVMCVKLFNFNSHIS